MSAALAALVASNNPNLPPLNWLCCRSEFMGCLALHVGKGEKETLRPLNQTQGAKKTLWPLAGARRRARCCRPVAVRIPGAADAPRSVRERSASRP